MTLDEFEDITRFLEIFERETYPLSILETLDMFRPDHASEKEIKAAKTRVRRVWTLLQREIIPSTILGGYLEQVLDSKSQYFRFKAHRGAAQYLRQRMRNFQFDLFPEPAWATVGSGA